MHRIVAVTIGMLFLLGCAQSNAPKTEKAAATQPQRYKKPKTHSIPLRFLPDAADNDANWSRLSPFPNKDPKTLMMTAHSGVGGHFPVKDHEGQTLFEITLTAGDNDHLVLRVQAKDVDKTVELQRDKSVAVQISGRKYDLWFPTVSVRPEDGPSTSKAMIMVTTQQ